MRWLQEQFHRFWFEPVSAANLGFCRLLFFGLCFLFFWSRDFYRFADVPDAFWEPIDLFRVLAIPVLSAQTLAVLQVVWKGAMLFACIGLFTRWSIAVSLALGLYLIGLTHNFGKVNHSDAVLLFTMLILVPSRCGDAFSIDGLIRAARNGSATETDLPHSGEYRWPVRMVWILMTLVFFNAGMSKLRASRLNWVLSDYLSTLLVSHHYSHQPLSSVGLHLAQYKGLCRLLAAGSLLMEVGMPLALFSRIARMVLVPGILMMQVGILVFMGVSFLQFMICYVFWVPWDRVGARLISLVPAGTRRVILFDGSCGMCRSTAAVLRRLDLLHQVEFVDVVAQWPEIDRRFRGLCREECLHDMHVIDKAGGIVKGFHGYRSLARVIPAGWLTLPLFYLPGVPRIGTAVYSWVARHRYSGACGLQNQPESSEGRKSSAVVTGKTAHL